MLASPVVPEPLNGSKTVSPSSVENKIARSGNATGICAGCAFEFVPDFKMATGCVILPA